MPITYDGHGYFKEENRWISGVKWEYQERANGTVTRIETNVGTLHRQCRSVPIRTGGKNRHSSEPTKRI